MNAGRPTNDILELIDQLEAEKRQLQDRLQKEQAQVSINGDFQRLLVQASNMRQAQDDELRLERQREEQLLSLTFAKQRLKQANRMLKLIESCEGKPIEIVIDHLGHEYQQSVHHLEANTIPERQNAELRLLQASKTKPDLDRVGVDCVSDDDMMSEIHELLNRKQMELDNLSQHVHKSNKLTLLKQVSRHLVDLTRYLNAPNKLSFLSCHH